MNRLIIILYLIAPAISFAQYDVSVGKVHIGILNTKSMFPPLPNISFIYPTQSSIAIDYSLFTIKGCVSNINFPEKEIVKIKLNENKPQIDTLKKSDLCPPNSLYFSRTISLREGENTVEIIANNISGVITREVSINNHKPEKSIALIIGNSKYPGKAKLDNPVNDAIDMAKLLNTRLNFREEDIFLRLDLSKEDMDFEIAQFAEKIENYQVIIFYYAGHGMEIRNKNYLIPIDGIPQSETLNDSTNIRIRNKCVDLDKLIENLEQSNASVNLIILDACRNNPFIKSGLRSVKGTGGLGTSSPTTSSIAYSTQAKSTVEDGTGRNSLYTETLLQYLPSPGLTLGAIFQKITDEVFRKSIGDQRPYNFTTNHGSFIFLPK
ncbi:caspase family protein [Runella salmonicolor]|uniref:Caspase family protein n=1 Tax=Runella salmonicolor TaxID=2950278 RepID=A0ABT1FK54_9BACT|nr:caspase family protein [Runella salmonicolor]MCP1381905.1 caspase family protein [Runella salmonicolor]